jgi:hypothetical protein
MTLPGGPVAGQHLTKAHLKKIKLMLVGFKAESGYDQWIDRLQGESIVSSGTQKL